MTDIYRAFIAPPLNYCSVVASLRVSCDQLGETLREAPTQLHHCDKRGSDKLEKINERALRFVTRDKSTTY